MKEGSSAKSEVVETILSKQNKKEVSKLRLVPKTKIKEKKRDYFKIIVVHDAKQNMLLTSIQHGGKCTINVKIKPFCYCMQK